VEKPDLREIRAVVQITRVCVAIIRTLCARQEEGWCTYFVEPWITEKGRRSGVDREVKFADSQLCHSVKSLTSVAYGELIF